MRNIVLPNARSQMLYMITPIYTREPMHACERHIFGDPHDSVRFRHAFTSKLAKMYFRLSAP
jgi:hypothetical protein